MLSFFGEYTEGDQFWDRYMIIWLIISKLDIFSLILWSYIVCQCDVKHNKHDKSNNVSFEYLYIHYHSFTYRTRCDTGDNVCLKLQICRYSICVGTFRLSRKVWRIHHNLDYVHLANKIYLTKKSLKIRALRYEECRWITIWLTTTKYP